MAARAGASDKRLICAIGNSHLGAAKRGWDAIAEQHPEYDFDFFGFPPDSALAFDEHAVVDGRWILPISRGARRTFHLTSGKWEIDASKYIAFAVFGLGLGGPLTLARAVCATHRPYSEGATAESYMISKACLSATIGDMLRWELSLAPFRAIRAASPAPIFCLVNPQPTNRVLENPAYKNEPMAHGGLIRFLKQIYDRESRQIGRSETYRYLSQPDVTLDERGFSKDEYISAGGLARDDPWLGRSKKENVGHGNREYGIAVIEQLLRHLSQTDFAKHEANVRKAVESAVTARRLLDLDNRISALRAELDSLVSEREHFALKSENQYTYL